MPLCDTDFQRMLDEGLGASQALKYMLNVCEGVEYLHAEDILHRDLKPLNIIMLKTKDNITYIPKICDFGLAKHSMGGVSSQVFGISGTMVYMPPEWIVPKQPSDRNCKSGDNWAIGVIIYQIIEHKLPFQPDSIGKIIDFEYLPLAPSNKDW